MASHRQKKRRRVVVGLVAALGVAGGGAAMLASTAAAGPTPGTYTYYSFPSGTGSLKDVTWTTTPQFDPGYTANIFWSHQFSFDNGQGAYFGMQSNGGQKRTLLFSVWDTDGAKKGPDSTCEAFGGEGEGQHCQAHVDWTAGHTYKFSLAPKGDGWFTATVTDATTNTSTEVGTIKAAKGRVATGINSGGMIDWTEYFEWSQSPSNCFNQPAAAVTFAPPTGNGGTVTAKVSGSSVNGTCGSAAKVETTAQGSVHRTATGNSTRGLVRNDQKCLRAPGGGKAALSDCNTTAADRAWVYSADRTLRLRSDNCLTANGPATAAGACQGDSKAQGKVTDPAKQWTYDPTAKTFKNNQSGLCLTAAADTTTSTKDCTGTPDQKWTLPTTGTADPTPVPPTPTPVPPVPPVPPTTPPGRTSSLTDSAWTAATSGWGPAEKNKSNGEQAAGDGRTLTIRGTAYPKGIGAHAPSTITYDLAGTCKTLTVDVGLDDETHGKGSVSFEIYRDTTKVADSGTLTSSSPVQHLTADLTGGKQLRLVVTNGGDDINHDHADWANPQLTCG
ncbi:NPCBM/NEW2 domain-containing protein [Kitasatospora sp. NPDC088346]|uniref:NPCBM/NEW2 domain-containing protein n=1 Tax=Kitasatospora sp. NPDC088346 TaxID=3364073 RepID=UPI0038143FBF